MNPDLPQETMWRDDSEPRAKGNLFVKMLYVRRYHPFRVRLDGRDQHRHVVAMTNQVAMGVEFLSGDSFEPLRGNQFERQRIIIYQSRASFVIEVEPTKQHAFDLFYDVG